MRLIAPLFIVALALAIPTTAFADANERLANGEIIVVTSDVDGYDVPKVTVYGVIDTRPERVWNVVSNCDGYVGVMPRIDKAKEVSRSGSTVKCDVTVGLPFPMSDLRALSRAEHTEGPPEWRREWEMVEGDYEVNSGSWRVRKFQGDDNRTLAIYTVHAVPNSRVPERVRNRAQERSMPGIIEALREHLE
jgi:hypothetical protein